MSDNSNRCSRYYTVTDICQLYSIDKNNLLKYLRQQNILYGNRYINVCGKKKKNIKYNLPKKEYSNLFMIKKQKGKNGFINYKLTFTEMGKSFVGQVISTL